MNAPARTSAGRVALIGAGALACAVAAIIPLLGLGASLAGPRRPGAAGAPDVVGLITADLPLLARTAAVALLIGAVACGLAFPGAWSMRRLGPRWIALLLAPMLLPSYLVYASWGLLRAPGTWLGDLIARDAPTWAPLAASAQAIGGLALWAWPLAALLMGVSARRLDTGALDAMRMARAPLHRRGLAVLVAMRFGILGAVGVVAIIMLGSAVPLHVAQVETHAIAFWRRLDETGGAPSVWWSALPLLFAGALAGWLIGGRALGATSREASAEALPDRRVHGAWIAGAAGVWALSTLGPLALFAANLREARSLGAFLESGAAPAAGSLAVALAVAALGLLVACATSLSLGAPAGSWARRLGAVSLRVWLALALAPGVLLGGAIQSAASAPSLPLAFLGDTRAGVVLAHLARFGAVAALVGWWLAWMEPRDLVEQRRLAAPDSVRSWLIASAPMQAGALFGGAIAVGALSFHEIESAVILSPPGRDSLARHLLNLLHYLRVEELNAAGVFIMTGGVAVASLAALCAGRTARLMRSRTIRAALLALVLAPLLAGCGEHPIGAAEPIAPTTVFGEPGRAPGQFVYPRAIDGDGESLWIIDKTGRMQRLAPGGEPIAEWRLPSFANGYPVGVTCAPGGLVYIADTHEHRVLVCAHERDDAGRAAIRLVDQFGAYGRGPGEFYYVTDVAIMPGPAGAPPERVYVGEYGGADRVSVFDGAHEFLFSFGAPGSSEDVGDIRFSRPQSLLFHQPRAELFVADSSNHRVGRFTPDGELIAWFGRAGASPGAGRGEFAHPYGLAALPDGSILVAEFGNNRIQRIDPETGACLGLYGGAGRAVGELAYPWGVATIGATAFALDSGNNRVQAFEPGRARAPERADRRLSSP